VIYLAFVAAWGLIVLFLDLPELLSGTAGAGGFGWGELVVRAIIVFSIYAALSLSAKSLAQHDRAAIADALARVLSAAA